MSHAQRAWEMACPAHIVLLSVRKSRYFVKESDESTWIRKNPHYNRRWTRNKTIIIPTIHMERTTKRRQEPHPGKHNRDSPKTKTCLWDFCSMVLTKRDSRNRPQDSYSREHQPFHAGADRIQNPLWGLHCHGHDPHLYVAQGCSQRSVGKHMLGTNQLPGLVPG